MIEDDHGRDDDPAGQHGAAHGGWRRAVVGLLFGAGLGLVARIVLGPGELDPDGRRRG